MPTGQGNQYSKEYKLTAVMLMKSGLYKPKEVFELLGGIDRQTVYRWIKEYDEKGVAAFETKSVLDKQELARLKKENDELRLENEILKKATAYFAEKKKNG